MSTRLLTLMLVTALFSLGACGSSSTYYVPTDSPLIPFEAPDEEDLVEQDDDEEEEEIVDTTMGMDADTPATPATPATPTTGNAAGPG